jgi:hypothetical protein
MRTLLIAPDDRPVGPGSRAVWVAG